MKTAVITSTSRSTDLIDDFALIREIERGSGAAFETLMRRHNATLFRVARAILRDEADAEDALQEAYLSAYRHLAEFKGDAKLSTWLTRIVINQSLGHLRARRRDDVVVPFDGRTEATHAPERRPEEDAPHQSPESHLMRAQMRQLIERKIDELPLAFRTVFVMREVQELTVEETSACLSIPPATVRTRFFRARAMLRESLARELDLAMADVFSFGGARCDRIVAAVLRHLTDIRTPTSAQS